MGISADAVPLPSPLEGGREGASVIVEPIEAGRAHFPREFFEHEGGRVALGAEGARARRSRRTVRRAGPRLSRPASDRRRDARSTPGCIPRSPATRATTWAGRGAKYFSSNAGRTCLPAPGEGPRARRHRGRGPHPPPHRPRLGDLGVPRRHVRRQPPGVGGGDARRIPMPARLPPGALTTTPSTTHRRLRGRRHRLLRAVRPHVRPVRRRLGPPRLHARATRPGTCR